MSCHAFFNYFSPGSFGIRIVELRQRPDELARLSGVLRVEPEELPLSRLREPELLGAAAGLLPPLEGAERVAAGAEDSRLRLEGWLTLPLLLRLLPEGV